MKKNIIGWIFSCMVLLPFVVFAEQIQVEIPEAVTDLIGGTVDKFISGTFVMSTVFVAAVQIIKKVMEKFSVEINGIKSQILTVIIGILYSLIETGVWQDGIISNADIVTMSQAALAVISGVFGYKLLWRKPGADVTVSEKK
ncbi:MAG: hypothetical protein M0P12_01095 [Paludibacteraceae bacterium]|nr:hypothetical protein [Paludibacteraceae bacterium]